MYWLLLLFYYIFCSNIIEGFFIRGGQGYWYIVYIAFPLNTWVWLRIKKTVYCVSLLLFYIFCSNIIEDLFINALISYSFFPVTDETMGSHTGYWTLANVVNEKKSERETETETETQIERHWHRHRETDTGTETERQRDTFITFINYLMPYSAGIIKIMACLRRCGHKYYSDCFSLKHFWIWIFVIMRWKSQHDSSYFWSSNRGTMISWPSLHF